jgi:hypothetical protein
MSELEELKITDLGGHELDPAELYSDELISWVGNMNPDLGTKNDPYYSEYKAFYDEIKNAKIITLDADTYKQSNKFEKLDLSGENEETEDIPDTAFMMFMGSILFPNIGFTPFSEFQKLDGVEYAAFGEDAGLAPMDDYTIPV